MEKLEKITTKNLPSADWHPFGKWKCKYSKKYIFISLGISCCFLMYASKLYKTPSVWYKFKTPFKELTVDEVMLSLSWAPSTSKFISFKNSSSAHHSVVRLELPRSRYCVGDTLNVLVEMRNYAGLPKAYGGDFILARIYSPELQAYASGDVTDFFNGTYRVRFPLFWPGVVRVSVRLIHSSEAVMILRREWMHDHLRAVHTGTFIQGKTKETSRCALQLNSDRPLCEYKEKEDGEYYACYHPRTLPCDSLTIMVSYKIRGPNLTKKEAQLFSSKNIGREINNSFTHVTVSGLKFIKNVINSKLAVDAKNNITVRWERHSHPWISYQPVNITTVSIPDIVDSIAVGGRQEDVTVVIGIGQHFRAYPPEVFIRRLQKIRRAILRLHVRSPQTNVVIKLENIRDLRSRMTQTSNWFGYMQNLAQRKVFEDMKVALVDAWDMTVATDSFTTHPNENVVFNELAVALSFICHWT